MKEIASSEEQVSNIMKAIFSPSDERTQGIKQAASALNQMDIVFQQNAQLVEESSSVSHEMNLQAKNQLSSVEIFIFDKAACN